MAPEFSEDELVTLFRRRGPSAELEAEAIRGLLDSAGIRAMVVRGHVHGVPPMGAFSVQVLACDQQEARELIEQAKELDSSAPGESCE